MEHPSNSMLPQYFCLKDDSVIYLLLLVQLQNFSRPVVMCVPLLIHFLLLCSTNDIAQPKLQLLHVFP